MVLQLPDEQKSRGEWIYLPPDANCLLSVGDHCLRSTEYVNVIVADKAPHLQYLDMDAAVKHCTKGIGISDWASNDAGQDPDVVMACAGDIPTSESLAAVAILRERCPNLKIRFVNVVDLFRLIAGERASPRPLGPRVRQPLHHVRTGQRQPLHKQRRGICSLPRILQHCSSGCDRAMLGWDVQL